MVFRIMSKGSSSSEVPWRQANTPKLLSAKIRFQHPGLPSTWVMRHSVKLRTSTSRPTWGMRHSVKLRPGLLHPGLPGLCVTPSNYDRDFYIQAYLGYASLRQITDFYIQAYLGYASLRQTTDLRNGVGWRSDVLVNICLEECPYTSLPVLLVASNPDFRKIWDIKMYERGYILSNVFMKLN
jgi:hypothetical protein